MDDGWRIMHDILIGSLTNSIYGGLLAAVIFIIRLAAGRHISKKYVCFLWMLVAVRLIMPASIESPIGFLPRLSLGHSSAIDMTDQYYDKDLEIQVLTKQEESFTEDSEDHISNVEPSKQNDTEHLRTGSNINKKADIPVVVWMLGCILMLGYMAVTWAITGRRVRFAVPETFSIRIHPKDVWDTEVRVYSAEDIQTPFLYGLIKPRIYLPYNLSEADRIHVIRHELAHIKRFDYALKPLFFAILAFYWYNPFIWLAYRMFLSDTEMACDEQVIDSYDEDTRREYAEALLSVAEGNRRIRMFSISFGSAPIKERIDRVISYKRKGRIIKVSSILVIAILSMTFSSIHAAGKEEIIITDYDLVVPMIDEERGDHYLLVPYYKDSNAYEMLRADDRLEAEVKEKSGNYLYERSLSDYTIRKNEAVGLEYIIKNNNAIWTGHVLLRDENDCRRYDELASEYAQKYAEVIPEADLGYIYADFEVKGLGGQCEDGFWFLQTGTLMYVDLRDQNIWRLGLTTDEYMRLEEWLFKGGMPDFDVTDYEAWKPVFDELEIEYDVTLDPKSKRYQGAVAWLEKMRGEFPTEDMSVEQIEEQLRYTIKRFDEDGDEVPFSTYPGMLIEDENADAGRTIIPIPDKIRQMMFDLNKEEFLKWNGMSVDTERMSVYSMYQEQAQKEDRLDGTWTLEQYERIYNRYFEVVVKEHDPDWQAGDEFDEDIIDVITRDEIEQYISSDGMKLILNR